MPLLDSLDDGAALVGAVNTVACATGRLIGYNTDMAGFRDSFAQRIAGSCVVARVLAAREPVGQARRWAALFCRAFVPNDWRIADVRRDRAENVG